MNWNELKQKAKELGYVEVCKIPRNKPITVLVKDGYGFYPEGIVEVDCSEEDDCCGYPFAYGRTPKQMWQIMEALK